MMQSTPYITPADPLPATTTSFVQSQIPLVQSTQILTQPQPVVTSQVLPATSIAPTPAVTAPQVSYVPVASTIQQASTQPAVSTGVRVVPIYDDF